MITKKWQHLLLQSVIHLFQVNCQHLYLVPACLSVFLLGLFTFTFTCTCLSQLAPNSQSPVCASPFSVAPVYSSPPWFVIHPVCWCQSMCLGLWCSCSWSMCSYTSRMCLPCCSVPTCVSTLSARWSGLLLYWLGSCHKIRVQTSQLNWHFSVPMFSL
jgi:hypothetical protein